MNRNSERNRPTPSPPSSMTRTASPGVPMLPSMMMRRPSLVSPGRSRNAASIARRSSSFAFFSANFTSVSSSGCAISSPAAPSISSSMPSSIGSSFSPAPTTAGMPIERAMMAEWLVRPPIFVIKPTTGLPPIFAVSDGVRSFATTMHGSVIVSSGFSAIPLRFLSTRIEISPMSAARACIYSSSIARNIA